MLNKNQEKVTDLHHYTNTNNQTIIVLITFKKFDMIANLQQIYHYLHFILNYFLIFIVFYALILINLLKENIIFSFSNAVLLFINL